MAAESVSALQSAGPAGATLVPGADGDDGGGWDVLGAAGEVDWLAGLVPGVVVPCVCGWPCPQALSSSATPAAAVVRTDTCVIP